MVSFGVTSDMDIAERARIMVTNSFCVIVISLVFLLSIAFSAVGSYSILESLTIVPLLVTVLYFNRRGYYPFVRFVFSFGMLFLIFLLALSDRRTGTEYALIAVACSSTFAFQETKWVILSYITALALYVIYLVLDAHLYFEPDPTVDYPFTRATLVVVSAFVVFFEMLHFRLIVKRYSDALYDTNERLTNSNAKLNTTNSRLDSLVAERTLALEKKNEELVQKNRYLDSLAAELKQRNAELDQIVYRLSHNIRAPLHSIAGLVHLMRVDHDPVNNKEALARIDNQLDEMGSVFRSMNGFISVVMNDVAVARLSLDQLLMEAISLQEGTPGFADVMIALDTGEQDEIYSDRGLLLSLFESIVSNAIVFRSRARRGHLRISVRRRGMVYLITFSDNGIGIDDRVKNQIFDMFYRGSEYSQGPGLGLYISREIVRKLKGSIHITSAAEGTSVMVSIPTLGNIPPVYSPARVEDGFPEW